MKEKVSKLVLQVVKGCENEVETNVYSWPPICMGFTHQPTT